MIFDDVNIDEKEIVEIDFETFKIVFDNGTIYAESKNYDLDEDIIIIEDNETTLLNDIMLFDKYLLTLNEFDRFKKAIQRR